MGFHIEFGTKVQMRGKASRISPCLEIGFMAAEGTGFREEPTGCDRVAAAAEATASRGDEAQAIPTAADQATLEAIDEILARIDRRLEVENEAMDRLLASLARRAA